MKKGIREIAAYLFHAGVRKVVLSPGSRCAPLTIAFTEHPGMECYQIIDERSAAFFALGLSLASGEAVAMICTSGSAVLNYAPALAEAFYSDVPLLALTADRPAYKIGHQDGQAINQHEVYKNYIRHSVNLNADFANEKEVIHALSEIKTALTKLPFGPVHVNFQFDEPLYALEELNPHILSTFTFPEKTKGEMRPLPDLNGKRIMLLVGQTKEDERWEAILSTCKAYPQLVVVGEAISNLPKENSLRNLNEYVRHADGDTRYIPDILFSFGKGIVSKIWKNTIQKSKDIAHYHVDIQGREINTYGKFKGVYCEADIDFVHRLLENLVPEESDFQLRWQELGQALQHRFDREIPTLPFSDVWAYAKLLRSVPRKMQVHVANSMAIRYVQFLESFIPHDCQIWVNRGVSGIDGSGSTAVGFSQATEDQVLYVCGDLAFHYDVNAFWNGYVKPGFKVVVFNNNGGGIFRLIEGPNKKKEWMPHFETPCYTHTEAVAIRSKMDYFCARNGEELTARLSDFWNNKAASILEIFTDAENNGLAYKQWIELIHKK